MTTQSSGPPRIVIDTSVTLPLITRNNPQSSRLVQLWQNRLIIPLINSETIQELRAKLLEISPTPKPLQAQRFADNKLRQYRPWCEETPLARPPQAPRCRDTNDQKFIDLAITANADALITRDNDLLSMKDQVPFGIINEVDFLKPDTPDQSP